MNTFLPPIEKPDGLIMKLAYYFTRRQFGKVLTPLKVHSARLPPAFGLFYSKVSKLDQKLTLPPEMILLIRHQVARINICLFCIDIARSFTIKASMNEAKFDALEQYTTSPLFTDAERAALDYVTELTKEKKLIRIPLLACPVTSPNARSARSSGLLPASILQHDQYRSEHPFGYAL
jgi:hypothetical protein